jgi:membrane-bound lytic murein transglycosylase D
VRQAGLADVQWQDSLMRLGRWGLLGAILIVLAFLITREATTPAVVKNPGALPKPSSGPQSAYSISALHRRLPADALNEIQRYLDFFTTKQRRRVEDGLARSGRYMDAYRQIFREEGIPEELVYLPMIESGFMENAVSPAKAVGVWQFIEETGKLYDLHHDDWSDRRRDPLGSARAAAKLLAHLYDTFGDWDLALAAYNSGAGTVKWAVKVNAKAKESTQYWNLNLPEETRNYVPAFIAMVLIAKNPSAFGFNDIQFHAKIVFDQIKVSPGVPLQYLGESLGVDVDQLFELNPELIRGEIPPGDKPYTLRVPVGTRSRVLARLAGSTGAASDYFVYQVKQADTLQLLANQFPTRFANIQKLNQIKDDGDLSNKRFLIIPL